MTIDTTRIATAADAVRAQAKAHRKRVYAADLERRDRIGARELRVEADALDDKAAAILDPANYVQGPLQVGRGGELVVDLPDAHGENVALVDTVRQSPDMLIAEASAKRLELAAEAGVLPMAVDVGETIQARNSLEKMLAGQLAALHMAAMKNAATAASFGDTAAGQCGNVSMQERQIANVEAVRSANAAARASEAFQRGVLTLQRLRNGGRQTVVVQHVTVADGGQALVAGAVRPGAAGGGEDRDAQGTG